MARDPYPSETQERFIIRLPDGMRERIKAKAEANGRSMNAEIVVALEKFFPEPRSAEDAVNDVMGVLAYYKEPVRSEAIAMLKAIAQSDGFKSKIEIEELVHKSLYGDD